MVGRNDRRHELLSRRSEPRRAGGWKRRERHALKSKKAGRTFDLEEYVIKEVVTFVRRGLDKVGKANAKVVRYPQRPFWRVAEIAFLLRRRNPCFHRIADRKRC